MRDHNIIQTHEIRKQKMEQKISRLFHLSGTSGSMLGTRSGVRESVEVHLLYVCFTAASLIYDYEQTLYIICDYSQL